MSACSSLPLVKLAHQQWWTIINQLTIIVLVSTLDSELNHIPQFY